MRRKVGVAVAATLLLAVAVGVPSGCELPVRKCVRVRVVATARRRTRTVVRCTVVAPPPSAPRVTPPPSPYEQYYLTRDGRDAFAYASVPSGFVAVGDFANSGSNTRVVLADTGRAPASDGQLCATFSDSGLPAQEGLALRVRTTPDAVRAVTVTKNVYFGEVRLVNVHVWDTGRAGAKLELVGQQDLTLQLGTSPLPWRICAQAVGDLVRTKEWPVGSAEPSWDDPGQVGIFHLPAGWSAPGWSGPYVGHLPRGGTATYYDVAWSSLPSPPSPTTTTTTTSSTVVPPPTP